MRSPSENDLLASLVAFSEWQGYGHGERAGAWLERLQVNRPEIDAFMAAPTPQLPPYVARACALRAPAGDSAGARPPRIDFETALANARAKAPLNAFTFLPESADGGGDGFLRGAAVAVKDLMEVNGWPLSGGGTAMGRPVARTDAAVVARIRAAGGVPAVASNLHEFAYGVTSDNPHFGRVMNPVSPDRIPGGSSGGSAAAIAAGIVRHAIGTDTSGSIRIPAACCGVVGLKPTYDALPRTGVIDLAASLDHVGPMARTVDECAELFAAMLGLPAVPPWTRTQLSGLNVARLGGYFADPVDAEVARAVDEAAAALRKHGATVGEAMVSGASLTPAIQLMTIAPEATAFHLDRLRAEGEAFGEDVRVRLEMGLFFPAAWYAKAQRMRSAWVQSLEASFARSQILLCPTLRVPAPRIGSARASIASRSIAMHTAITGLTLPFNLAGVPALSLPWGTSSEGVPIGIQVIGARGSDWEVLAIARLLEQDALDRA